MCILSKSSQQIKLAVLSHCRIILIEWVKNDFYIYPCPIFHSNIHWSIQKLLSRQLWHLAGLDVASCGSPMATKNQPGEWIWSSTRQLATRNYSRSIPSKFWRVKLSLNPNTSDCIFLIQIVCLNGYFRNLRCVVNIFIVVFIIILFIIKQKYLIK